jgi:hypothetical protein
VRSIFPPGGGFSAFQRILECLQETLLLVLSTVLENEVRAVANEALAEAMAGQNRSGCSLPAGQDPHHYDLEEAADVVRLLERLLGLPPDLATWAPLQRLINGSALRVRRGNQSTSRGRIDGKHFWFLTLSTWWRRRMHTTPWRRRAQW